MGLIHIYNSFDNKHESFTANGKIKDIVPNLGNFIVIKAGKKIDVNYEVVNDDIIYIRRAPAGGAALGVVAIVSAVVAVGVGIGSIIYANSQSEALQEQYEKQQKEAAEKAERVDSLPFLKGTKNQIALGRTIPYVMGSMYFTPYSLLKTQGGGFYTISGTDGERQFWSAIFTCGYNNQKIQSISIGNNKICDYDISEEYEQGGVRTIEHPLYGNIQVEIENHSELVMDGLSQKVIGESFGDEIKHDFGQEAEPLIKQLPENVQRVDVCIKFDGLRQYDNNGWGEREVEIIPYWSNVDNPTEPEDWHEFSFDVNSTSYQWQDMTNTQIESAISSGLISVYQDTISTGPTTHTTVNKYVSNTADIVITCDNFLTGPWIFKHKVAISQVSNRIIRNTNKTIRFVASKTFTAEESFGKQITIKLVRNNSKLENNNGQETAILQYINTYCYDAYESDDENLVPCRPLQQPFRDQVLRIGVKIEASQNTENILDEINVMTYGCARIFINSVLSTDKHPTRNPAAWILDILTSDYHKPSKISLEEINLQSFLTAYNYCEENNFYCDTVITSATKKNDIITKILTTIGGALIINSDGLYELILDKAENTPVALLTSQSITGVRFAKTLQRKITGLKTTYPDRNSWQPHTEYFMRDGRTTYNQDTDRLGELALDTVTEHDHAYKVAQRQQRQTILQPRTISVDVGMEGELYPLYSLILLQLEQFKQGLRSSVIHELIYTEGFITGIKIADRVEILDGFRYGVIIQAQNNTGRQLIYREVTGEGLTDELTFTEGLSPAEVQPDLYNQLSFGLLTEDGDFVKVTNKMKIYGITPSDNHGWTLELKDYNPDIYEVGTIPDYKSNLTSRPTTQISLPTVTQNDINTALQEANNYTRITSEGLSARIDDIVTDVVTLGADKQSVIYDLDGEGRVIRNTTTEIQIYLRQGEMDLDFIIGNINLPSGFTYIVEGKTLKLTVAEGTRISTNTIQIPVLYRSIVSINNYVDENGEIYVDENGIPYGEIEYSTSSTEFPLYFTYFGSGGGVYSGSISQEEDLPNNLNIGDYIVWSGETTSSILIREGTFTKSALYRYVGVDKSYFWEHDNTAEHVQIALSNILGVQNNNLESDNEKAYEFISNLAANLLFVNKMIAKSVEAGVVTSDFLQGGDAVFSGTIKAAHFLVTGVQAGNVVIKKFDGSLNFMDDGFLEQKTISLNICGSGVFRFHFDGYAGEYASIRFYKNGTFVKNILPGRTGSFNLNEDVSITSGDITRFEFISPKSGAIAVGHELRVDNFSLRASVYDDIIARLTTLELTDVIYSSAR